MEEEKISNFFLQQLHYGASSIDISLLIRRLITNTVRNCFETLEKSLDATITEDVQIKLKEDFREVCSNQMKNIEELLGGLEENIHKQLFIPAWAVNGVPEIFEDLNEELPLTKEDIKLTRLECQKAIREYNNEKALLTYLKTESDCLKRIKKFRLMVPDLIDKASDLKKLMFLYNTTFSKLERTDHYLQDKMEKLNIENIDNL